MEKILNELKDKVLIINKRGNTLFANKALLEELQYGKDEVVNTYINNYLFNDENISRNILSNVSDYIEKKVIINLRSKLGEKVSVKGKVVLDKWEGRDSFYLISHEQDEDDDIKEYLKSFVDNSPNNCFIKNLNDEYVYINNSYCQMVGLDREEFIGKHIDECWDKEHCKFFKELDEYVLNTKLPVLNEKYFKDIHGQEQWIEVYKMPLMDEKGNIKYIAGYIEDITLLRKLEIKVASSYNNVTHLSNSYDENNDYQVLEKLKYDIVESLGADGLGIWVYDEETESISPKFKFGLSEQIMSPLFRVQVDKEKFKYDKKYLEYEGLRKVEEIKTAMDVGRLVDLGVTHVGIYSIMYNEERIGFLRALFKGAEKVTANRESFIKTMCNQVGVLIRNDMLSETVKMELDKRKEIEWEIEHFLNTAADMMAIFDEVGKVLKVGGGWAKSLGWSNKEITKMHWTKVIYPDDLNRTMEFLDALKNKNCNSVRRIAFRCLDINNNIRWLDCGIKFIEDKRIFISSIRDITDEKRLEEERRNFEEVIIRENIKSEFFANISHEFKTPLNIILATMQLINIGIKNNNIQAAKGVDIIRYVTSIRQNSYRLLRLVNNLIDISRIDAGYYKINLENHNIVSIVEDITMSVSQYIEGKGISLVFDTEVEEAIIACDPDKIERVMLNLLSNAVKYTDSNGEINVNMWLDDENIVISVKDSGSGIPQDKLSTIFERFVQVDDSLTKKSEGSGIGLSLVKSLVEMHGGTIEAKSTVNIGTEFIFRLPRKQVEFDATVKETKERINSQVEKCNVEFSEIYEA